MSTKTGHQLIDSLVDVNGITPPLYAYVFTSVSGTATLTGFFVDRTGVQVALMETFSVTAGTTLTALYNTAHSLTSGTELPATLVGFDGVLSGSALWFGKSGLVNGTFGEAPKSGYPQLAIATRILIGRVGV